MTRLLRGLVAPLLLALGGAPRVMAGWVDPDTPDAARTTASHYGGDEREYELVRHSAGRRPRRTSSAVDASSATASPAAAVTVLCPWHA